MVALVMAIGFVVLFLVSPRMTSESVVVEEYGWGAGLIIQIFVVGLPVVTLLGLALLSFKEVLGKKHYGVEPTLYLGGRDVTGTEVEGELGSVEAKQQALHSYRSTCPSCGSVLNVVIGVKPTCSVCGESWASSEDLAAALRAVGAAGEAGQIEALLSDRN
jgi:hypothetical protein